MDFKNYFELKRLALIFSICLLASVLSWYFAHQSVVMFFVSGAIYLAVVYIAIFKLHLINRDILPVRFQKIISRVGFLN